MGWFGLQEGLCGRFGGCLRSARADARLEAATACHSLESGPRASFAVVG